MVGLIADLASLGPLFQGLTDVNDVHVLEGLLGLRIEHIVVVGPVVGGQDILHDVTRGGHHDEVCGKAGIGSKPVEIGQVVQVDLFVVHLGGVDEVVILALIDVLGGIAAGEQGPVGIHTHEEVTAGDLVGGEGLQVLLELTLHNGLGRNLREARQVALLVLRVLLVGQEEEEKGHHSQEAQKNHGGQYLIEFFHVHTLLRTGNTGRDCSCRSPGWPCTAGGLPGRGQPPPGA